MVMLEFKTAIQIAKNFLQKSDPVFCNFILSIKSGQSNVLAIGDSCQIDIPIDPNGFDRLEHGIYLVPNDILGIIKSGDYHLSTRFNTIFLTSDHSSYEFNISPYQDPLPTSNKDSQVSFDLDPDRMSLALDGVSSSRGFDSSKPHLCGVNFSCDSDGHVRLTATDGVCLATEVVGDGIEFFPSFSVPGSSLRGFKDVLGVSESVVTLSIMVGDPVPAVKLSVAGVELTLSVLPGRGDYDSIIPQFELNPYVFPITASSDIFGKLDRLSYVDIVDLVFSDTGLRISGQSSSCSGVEFVEFPDGLSGKQDKGDFEVAVGLPRLKSLVKSLLSSNSSDFFIRLRSPTSPLIFTPSPSPDHYLDSLRLIMPVQRR